MPSLDPPLGALIGNYRLERLIGRGGMGQVYEALNEQIGSPASWSTTRA